MNEELLQQAMGLFDTNEKWTAFWELHLKVGDISLRWQRKLLDEVHSREFKENNTDWDVYTFNNCDIRWFLRGESNYSFSY